MNDLLVKFIEDLKDNNIILNEALMDIENGNTSYEIINSIFRVAHTIKGNSAAMEFKLIEEVMHKMEDILHEVREGKRELGKEIINILYSCHDFLEDCTEIITSDGNDNNIQTKDLLEKLNLIKGNKIIGKEEVAITDDRTLINENSNNYINSELILNIDPELLEVIEQNMKRGFSAYVINVMIDPESKMKWMRAWIVFQKVDNYATFICSNPSRPIEDNLNDDNFKFEGNMLSILLLTQTQIDELITEIESGIEIIEVSSNMININQIIENKKINKSKKNNEISLENKEDKINNNLKKKNDLAHGELMRIPVQKIDSLIDMLEELLIVNSQLEQQMQNSNNSRIRNNVERMIKITKQVQNLSLSLRMVEIKSTLHRLTRIVRDTASELNKEVKVIIEGEDTEIDKSVSEKLFDPLMHLVRNAVSHGIESREERISTGKDQVGIVTIKAYNKRGSVYIEVTDDGKGIDPKKILKKAKQLKIAKDDIEYSEEEIIKFIFSPGFSTQSKINNISGRGVGMNVVESNIKKIRGKVDIVNNLGKGCSFIVKIPMNIAVLNGTIIIIDNERYIIPTHFIKEFYIPKNDDWISIQGNNKAIKVRQSIIPIIEFNQMVGKKESDMKSNIKQLIILEMDQKLLALPVDNIIGRQEVVSKNLSNEFKQVNYALGASILGDGHVSIILDVESMFEIARI